MANYSDIQKVIDFYHSNGTPEQIKIVEELPNIINYAELLFGPRDIRYSLSKIYFSTLIQASPMPNNTYDIHIQQGAASDFIQALYQLSHEWMHVHAPIGSLSVINLEEGVTTYFSREYLKAFHHLPYLLPNQNDPQGKKYFNAYTDLGKLLSLDSFAIKTLRSKNISLSKITMNDIITEFPGIDKLVAQRLTNPF